MKISKKLKDEIWEYCRLNDISNVDEFTINMVQQGFTVEKFGATPFGEGEVKEVEKIIEVPVEKIVEKVIKKEIFITDDDEVKKLSNKNIELVDIVKELKNKLGDKTKDKTIDVLNKKIKDMDKTNSTSNKKIENLEKELKDLKEKLETTLKDNNKDSDIYKDGKRGGWFGSNLLKK